MTTTDNKFKLTKRLVKIALENGYTNKQIAQSAGLSGKSISLVTRWKQGEALATKRQMSSLLKDFGHILKRQTEHLFSIYEVTPNGELSTTRFFIASGEILLKHKLVKTTLRNSKPNSTSLFRVIILHIDDNFQLVIQARIGLRSPNDTNQYYFHNADTLVHSNVEDSMWSVIANYTQLTLEKLLDQTDTFANNLTGLCPNIDKNEGISLQFIVRQALLKHGYKPLDMTDLPALSLI